MSIKIDPDTQKAVCPEDINKDLPQRACMAVLAVCVFLVIVKVIKMVIA